MTNSQADSSIDLRHALVESYAVNERMNQIVLEHLHPAAWRAKPPGSRARTIAAIFSHVHNIRRKWLRLSAPHLTLPVLLNRATCTQKTDQRRSAEKRRALLRDACRRSDASAWPGHDLSQGRLGTALARWWRNARLHDHPRRTSSRTGHHARPSARIPAPGRCRPGALALGESVEGVWIHHPR